MQNCQSRPEHITKVSVCAIDPDHQGHYEQHKGPGDPIGACRKRAGFGGTSSLSDIRVVSSAYLRVLIFLLAN